VFQANIWLVGFMGSGKSAIAEMLSRHLDRPYVDTDFVIEQSVNDSIGNIFKRRGELYFRVLERQLLFKLNQRSNYIIATGGGFPGYLNKMEELKKTGVCIHLSASYEVLWNRIQEDKAVRPLASEEADFRKLFQKRHYVYSQAQFQVDASQSFESICMQINTLIRTSV
jgi:shikimate kinase